MISKWLLQEATREEQGFMQGPENWIRSVPERLMLLAGPSLERHTFHLERQTFWNTSYPIFQALHKSLFFPCGFLQKPLHDHSIYISNFSRALCLLQCRKNAQKSGIGCLKQNVNSCAEFHRIHTNPNFRAHLVTNLSDGNTKFIKI